MTSVYVLKLLSGKYYVGKSKNPFKRIKQHFNMKGSRWTKKYHPLEVMKIYPDSDGFDEDKYTKILMDKYGIDNVRGGSFCNIRLQKYEIEYLKRSIRGATDRCYICGEKHFVDKCPKANSV